MNQLLSPEEKTLLATLEQSINHSAAEFIDAVQQIRDKRLYRETHATFEDYCRAVLGKSRKAINDSIHTQKLRDELKADLAPTGAKQVPIDIQSISQKAVKKLAEVPKEERKAVIQSIKGPVTAKAVDQAIPVGYKKDAFGRLCRDLSGYNPYTEQAKAKPKQCSRCNGTGVEA